MDLVSFKKGLKSTLKSEDTEGFFEIYVTRSSGYLWALFFKKLDADMVGIGPFIPHPDTPLANSGAGDFYLALKVMSIIRLLLPYANIPATTAMETLHKNGRRIALESGANVVMPNFTALDYQKKYEIYPDKILVDYSKIVEELTVLGRTVSKQKGNRKGK